MPGQGDETAAIFKWIAENLSPDTYVNVMGQYHPDYQVGPADKKGKYININRRPCAREIQAAREAAMRAGLTRLDQRH